MPSCKEELEAMFVPGAEYLFLRPRCHPDSAITAAYSKSQGAVIIACATCNFGVADLAIAKRADLPAAPVRGRKGKVIALPRVVDTPNHIQDQRAPAKANRRRRRK